VCRRLIGRNKLRQQISYKDYAKQIQKNAKKGMYKNLVPPSSTPQPAKKQKKDTLIITKDTTRIAKVKLAPVVVPILKADSLITLSEFLFETNSYKLKDQHYSQLDSLSRFLKAHPTLEVSISGHTDDTGNEHHNVTLSMQRAETVEQYLVDKGVSDEKILSEGFGSSKPIRENNTAEGRSKNRRVEILISNPKRK
jgi:outer membrane protein OmpA-like peptidoglycan-associated protein